jgi:UPF0755 protein
MARLKARSDKRSRLIAMIVVAGLLITAGLFARGWYGAGPLANDRSFVVPQGATLAGLADRLQAAGAIRSASAFRWQARVFARGGDIKAGEFLLPRGASAARIVRIIESDDFQHRLVTVPEGMPSVMIYDRLKAQSLLTGNVAVPVEGSVLPDSYGYQRGEPRAVVLARMQAAMRRTVAALWPARARGLAVTTPQQAVTLASIVEKETGKPAERATVAALYQNRLRAGMPLQADPTIIYPITRGKPLGRRILQSEIAARNGYNTYAMTGLPQGPITNPSRASIAAVLHPAASNVLYMVADGTGGHAFAATLAEHNRNVAKWFAIRHQRGEL